LGGSSDFGARASTLCGIRASHFPSTRAFLRGLAGVVAGAAVTIAAVADAPRETKTIAAAASSSGPVVLANGTTTTEAIAQADGRVQWGTGSLRLEEAQAELEYRRNMIVAASRSDARPSFVWPASGPLTGWWGERRGWRGHLGLDVDGSTGDPIVAAGDGVVEWSGQAPDGYGGYGQMVLIRHSSGMQTLYAHLSHIAVPWGAVVEAGDYIGAMGTTGNVTGSHLHFEVRFGGVPVNPNDWLPAR
jgi:murein DD-endopeptidase MepM/ murein hydrolase activator NlpD